MDNEEFKFDQKSLKALKAGTQTLTLSDPKTPGLVVRITAGGSKTYYFTYRMGGRATPKKWLKVGTINALPLVRAQELARAYRTQVDAGEDPGEVMKAKAVIGKTVRDLASQFERDYAPKLSPKTQEDYKRIIQLHILPQLGKVSIAELDRSQIQAWHSKITGSRTANLSLAVLSCMMTQAMLWGLRAEGLNPCSHVSKNPEIPRSRDIRSSELEAIGKAMKKLEGTHSIWALAAIRMSALCWGRISEVLGLRRDRDCHLDEGYAVIREHKTSRKSGPKTIELAPPAVDILRALPEQKGNPFYFPSPTLKNSPLTRHGVYKTWRAVCGLAGIDDLHIHDFRSLAASEGEAQGVSPKTMAYLLGHSDPRTTLKHYAKVRKGKASEVASQLASNISAALDGIQGDIESKTATPHNPQ